MSRGCLAIMSATGRQPRCKDAIHRLTQLPAANLASKDRGPSKPGFYGDVVVFDPATIADHATYAQPHQLATGVTDVFVNGTQVVAKGASIPARPRAGWFAGQAGPAGRAAARANPSQGRSWPIGPQTMTDSTVFFCGIGGSGMLPLASIVRARGGKVAGSDRSLDAGRTGDKYDYLRSLGIALHPQDGSGLTEGMVLVTSGAVEATVPDVVRARELQLKHVTRAQFLAGLFNAAQRSVAVGGTSGKSTVTAMIGWILHACHRQPTVMNGAVMKNFVTPSAPFASALVGDPELFVSEVDESDGSIALYRPDVAVITNITLDHKEMGELRALFARFLACAGKVVMNIDDPETRIMAEAIESDHLITFGFEHPDANFLGRDYKDGDVGAAFTLAHDGQSVPVALQVPGRHNASNALAALAATHALGVPVAEAAASLGRFEGTRRRLETVGTAAGVTVIDDFAHNPDKIDATLATLRAREGRLLMMFQPHGYGPLRKMGDELAASFARGMGRDDILWLPDPVYMGGTVERTRGSEWLAEAVNQTGHEARHVPERELDWRRAGDRGARWRSNCHHGCARRQP